MLRNERVVVEMRIGTMDAINFLQLSGTQCFMFIKAPKPFEQSLASQNFMKSGDAATESVGGVKECSVAIGDFHSESEKLG